MQTGVMALLGAALLAGASPAGPRVAGAAGPRAEAAAPVRSTTSGVVATRSGRRIAFRAVAGDVRVGGDDATDARIGQDGAAPAGSPSAAVSYVAYFAEQPTPGRRPLMFIYDGGPGTSSVSPLMASFGPVRAVLPGPGQRGSGGGAIEANPDTLLDVADVVFVDAPGTGLGRLAGPRPERSFYGVDQDAAAFDRFVRRFLKTYDRRSSPLYLFGESYGTMRSAVLAKRLEQGGVQVSGIVSLSQLLAFDNWSDGASGNVGTDNAFFLSLPSFAAAAWAHGKVQRPGGLEDFLGEVERFSLQSYAPALLEGSDLPAARKAEIADQLAAFTGVPARTWLDADLRIEASRFRALLEQDRGRLIGREDTRYDGPAPARPTDAVESDPYILAVRGPRRAAFHAYARDVLKIDDSGFKPYIDGPDTDWDMHHVAVPAAWPDTYVNAAPDLVAAMTANPRMRVLVLGGYFDLATPYFGSIYMVKHLPLPDDLRTNVTWRFYPGGHPTYLTDSARRDMHDRIADLVRAG